MLETAFLSVLCVFLSVLGGGGGGMPLKPPRCCAIGAKFHVRYFHSHVHCFKKLLETPYSTRPTLHVLFLKQKAVKQDLSQQAHFSFFKGSLPPDI